MPARRPSTRELDASWARHHAEWREPAQIASHWEQASQTDPGLLKHRVRGDWWELLDRLAITLFVTREYEHLVVALNVSEGKPRVSFFRLPHPSGLVFDRSQSRLHIASTRNPNQVFDFEPVDRLEHRLDVALDPLVGRPLVPVSTRFYPGSTYLHDLALVDGELYGNAVGHNAVVRLGAGQPEHVWWPRCIDIPRGPLFGQNHLQLNSIAAGASLQESFFSASTDQPSTRRPGHRNFPVDGRGVLFAGDTREPIVRGLTRPHSARLHRRSLWVANSGYGELGVVRKGSLESVTTLPGWTRGLCLRAGVAFVGTSRVIPRFRRYAPGLDLETSRCALHAVDVRSGKVLGSLTWPLGNQIFAVDWAPRGKTSGFPFVVGRRGLSSKSKKLFYAYGMS